MRPTTPSGSFTTVPAKASSGSATSFGGGAPLPASHSFSACSAKYSKQGLTLFHFSARQQRRGVCWVGSWNFSDRNGSIWAEKWTSASPCLEARGGVVDVPLALLDGLAAV